MLFDRTQFDRMLMNRPTLTSTHLLGNTASHTTLSMLMTTHHLPVMSTSTVIAVATASLPRSATMYVDHKGKRSYH
jgi:hypothetical protein